MMGLNREEEAQEEARIVRELRNARYVFVINLSTEGVQIYENDCCPSLLEVLSQKNLPEDLRSDLKEFFRYESERKLPDFNRDDMKTGKEEDLTSRLTEIYEGMPTTIGQKPMA